jgi:hypothetical protein
MLLILVNEITSAGAKSLEMSLPATLQVLNLEANAISDITPLLGALKERPLREVYLGSMFLSFPCPS